MSAPKTRALVTEMHWEQRDPGWVDVRLRVPLSQVPVITAGDFVYLSKLSAWERFTKWLSDGWFIFVRAVKS